MGGMMGGGGSDKQQMPPAFTADQLENKYSKKKGVPLDWPAQYEGDPTDARGNKNESYQAPQATQQWVPGVTLNSGGGYNAGNPYNLPTTPFALEAMLSGGSGFGQSDFAKNALQKEYTRGGGQGTAPADWTKWGDQGGGAQQATEGSYQTVQPSPADMSAAYMSAMAHPNAPQRQGANVPQAAAPSAQSNVLDQFLANWKAGGSQTKGAGNYDNSGFFKGLA